MINTAKIKAARERLHFSQEVLADRLNISQSSYARLESGKQKIEASQLFTLAAILQTPVTDFLSDKEQYKRKLRLNLNGDSPLLTQKYYLIPKAIYEHQLNLISDVLQEMRQERREFMEFMKNRLSGPEAKILK